MAKKAKKQSQKAKSDKNSWSKARPEDPWISMRTGVGLMTLLSLGMSVLTMMQTVPALGWVEGVLWGLGFGVAIWLVFVGFYFFTRWMRGRRS